MVDKVKADAIAKVDKAKTNGRLLKSTKKADAEKKAKSAGCTDPLDTCAFVKKQFKMLDKDKKQNADA